MILVDTSAWIEWLIDSSTGARVAEHLPGQADWLVPAMVQLELAKWLTREVGEDRADQVIAFTQVCQVVPLDTEIALAAAEACREHKLATADAIIFATARAHGAGQRGRRDCSSVRTPGSAPWSLSEADPDADVTSR